jgi:hypothetical protein
MAGEEISRRFGRAVEALVLAALPGRDVFYGKVDKPDAELTFPYVVVWAIPSARVRRNLSGTIASPDSRVQLTGVGRDPDEVCSALDHAAAALHGKKPNLGEGWNAGRIWEMPVEQAVTKNEDLWTPQGSPTYRGVSMFRLSSEPAPVAVES